MAIIIERTITVKNDQATLDSPLYLYQGDGDIVFLFSIKETKKATTFGTISTKNAISTTDYFSYGEVRIYKPDRSKLEFTTRAEIVDDKLQAIFERKHIDALNEVGIHKLQIHLYDSEAIENRFTIPPVDLHVLFPIGYDTTLIDEAIVDYSLLDSRAEYIPTFDAEGNYNRTVWETGDIITQDKLNKLEDALYEINAADSDFVTNDELDMIATGKANVFHTHITDEIRGLAYVATSGSYNDLYDKPNIPSASNFATKSELEGKAPITHNHDGVYAPTSHTHAGYAANNHSHDEYLTEVPATYATKTYVRDYVNDSGFITSIPSSYITETELENELAAKGYASEDYVIRTISEAQLGGGEPGDPSELLKNYATIAQLNTKADANHSHSSYLTQSSLDNYATKKYVDDAIENIERPGGTIDPSILENYPTIDVMNEALAGKADNGHTHDEYYSIKGHTHEDYALKSDIPDMVEIPSNISYFNNDKGYATTDDVNEALSNKADKGHVHDDYVTKEEIEDMEGTIKSNTITRIEIVEALPKDEEEGVLYIVKE